MEITGHESVLRKNGLTARARLFLSVGRRLPSGVQRGSVKSVAPQLALFRLQAVHTYTL